MECDKYTALIYELLDGVISEAQNDELERHLEACPQCAKEMVMLKNVHKSLKALPQAELPKDFHTSLHKKLIEITLPVKKTRRIPLLHMAATVAATFALMIFAYNHEVGLDVREYNTPASKPAIHEKETGASPDDLLTDEDMSIQDDDTANTLTKQLPSPAPESASAQATNPPTVKPVQTPTPHTEESNANQAVESNEPEDTPESTEQSALATSPPILADENPDNEDSHTPPPDLGASMRKQAPALYDSPDEMSDLGEGDMNFRSIPNGKAEAYSGGASMYGINIVDKYADYTVIKATDAGNLLDRIAVKELIEENVYKIPMSDYTAVYELISEYNHEILYNNPVNLSKSHFILVLQ